MRDDYITDLFKDPDENEKHFDFDEKDWNELEQRLDADDKRRHRGALMYFVTGAAAIGLILLGILLFNNNNDTIEADQPILAETEINNTTNESQDENPIIKSEIDISEAPTSNDAIELNRTIRSEVNFAQHNPKFDNSAEQPSNISNNKIEGETNAQNNENILIDEEGPVHQNSVRAIDKEQEKGNIQKPVKNELPLESPAISAENNNNDAELPDVQETFEDLISQKKRFSVSLGLKPYMTDEGFIDPGTFSGAAGIKFGLDVGKKSNVTTGIYYSNQNHTTPGNSYKNLNGYWNARTQGLVPQSVTAKNKVLEMPVQMTTKISDKERTDLYVGLGVNNTVTFHEKHEFNFTDPHYYGEQQWQVKKDNFQPLSSAKLIAGFETDIGKNVQLQVEPFVDIPLKGTAWGELELVNKGVALNFKLQK